MSKNTLNIVDFAKGKYENITRCVILIFFVLYCDFFSLEIFRRFRRAIFYCIESITVRAYRILEKKFEFRYTIFIKIAFKVLS